MASQKWMDKRFGERVKAERDHRGWSQADMAEMLAEKGVQPMHPTTVAKIEAGDRSVRINEAVGIADLFEISVDSLLGRKPRGQRSELSYSLRVFRDTARQSSQQVWAIKETIREQLEELPGEFDHADILRDLGHAALSNYLQLAYEALAGLGDLSEELLRRQEGKPDTVDLSVIGLRAIEDETQS